MPFNRSGCSTCSLVGDDETSPDNCEPQRPPGAKKVWFSDACKPDKENYSLASSGSSATVSTISEEYLVKDMEEFQQEMQAEIKKNTTDNSELRRSVSFLSDAVDKNNALLDNIRKELKKTQIENRNLRFVNYGLRGSVANMEERVTSLEKSSRKQHIEIGEIPSTQGKDFNATRQNPGKAVGGQMEKEKFIPASQPPPFNYQLNSPGVDSFETYDDMNAWLARFKISRFLAAIRANATFRPPPKVFTNEYLTPLNQLLLYKTKEAAKNKNYKYAWSKGGQIFVRKADGVERKRIFTIFDLEKL